MGHPGTKGDASEAVWLSLLTKYLPRRYRATKAFVVDSKGKFSQQMDVVIYDRQYSPFIFTFKKQKVVPAESVYAVFEAKQSISKEQTAYANKKIASVRKLHRTSVPIPTANGIVPAKKPEHIEGGLLTFDSDWNPPLGTALCKELEAGNANGRLDLGCVAAHGVYTRDAKGRYTIATEGKPATAFLFELIARLQAKATVPMIDIRAYAKWLT